MYLFINNYQWFEDQKLRSHLLDLKEGVTEGDFILPVVVNNVGKNGDIWNGNAVTMVFSSKRRIFIHMHCCIFTKLLCNNLTCLVFTGCQYNQNIKVDNCSSSVKDLSAMDSLVVVCNINDCIDF